MWTCGDLCAPLFRKFPTKFHGQVSPAQPQNLVNGHALLWACYFKPKLRTTLAPMHARLLSARTGVVVQRCLKEFVPCPTILPCAARLLCQHQPSSQPKQVRGTRLFESAFFALTLASHLLPGWWLGARLRNMAVAVKNRDFPQVACPGKWKDDFTCGPIPGLILTHNGAGGATAAPPTQAAPGRRMSAKVGPETLTKPSDSS